MLRILYSKAEIDRRIGEIGRQITEFYRGQPLTVIAMLNGGMFFAIDLIRSIDLPLWVDAMAMESYSGMVQNARICLRLKPKLPIRKRHILLVDDVLDSGRTLKAATALLQTFEPRSVRTAVLVEKMVPHPGLARTDWAGFVASDEFLIGCGMDFSEEYRNLPEIAVLE